MTLMLKVGLLAISAVQMCAQAKQPSVAKLRADAQNVARLISGDKLKTQTYCEIFELGDQIDDEQDAEKAEELRQKAAKLEEALGQNLSRWLVALEASIQIPKTLKKSVRYSIRSTNRVGWTEG